MITPRWNIIAFLLRNAYFEIIWQNVQKIVLNWEYRTRKSYKRELITHETSYKRFHFDQNNEELLILHIKENEKM